MLFTHLHDFSNGIHMFCTDDLPVVSALELNTPREGMDQLITSIAFGFSFRPSRGSEPLLELSDDGPDLFLKLVDIPGGLAQHLDGNEPADESRAGVAVG